MDNEAMIEAVARAIAAESGIEICSDAMYRYSTFGPKARAAINAAAPYYQDRIEALSAEVERLRVALGRIAADDSDEGCYAAAKARTALGETE